MVMEAETWVGHSLFSRLQTAAWNEEGLAVQMIGGKKQSSAGAGTEDRPASIKQHHIITTKNTP